MSEPVPPVLPVVPPGPAAVAPLDPFVGALVGERYRILARIGEGGMGTVYRVQHTLMNKVMALKLLHADLGRVDEIGRRFQREAQSASRLSHPNIIAVTDFGRAPSGELFLVMEYVPGQSLADLLDQMGRLPVGRALGIARQILAGLSHAHAQGVVHRDLKPANIMLTGTPQDVGGETIKLLDFGIAKMSAVGEAENEQPLTQGAMVFGTPSYMSPEQATAQEVDLRADLYSCGVLLYEMLTGRKPFVADDMVKIMALQVTQAPPSFAAAAPGVPLSGALEGIVMRALEKDRLRRFASADTFAHALSALGPQGNAGLGSWLPRLPSWDRVRTAARGVFGRLPWATRRWVPVGGGALAVVLALALAPLVCLRKEGPTAAPPRPLPIEPALQSPLRHIEDAMAKARLTEARALLMQQLSQHPESARVRYLLGRLEFLEKNHADGLQAFSEALRLDPGLRGDAALLLSVRSLLDDRRLGREALTVLVGQIGKPAGEILAEVASRDKRGDFRATARAACETLGCAKKVDRVGSYVLDLNQSRSCEEKRDAIKGLRATSDARAIEPLKKARRDRGVFGGLFGGNDCVRKDIDAALKELEN